MASGLALFASSAAADKKPEIIGLNPAEFSWETTAEGVAFAALEGDRFQEQYFAMVRLPAGLVSPPHTKTAAMYGMVVSGALVNIPSDDGGTEEKPLRAGAYYKIPAGLPHISKCVSETDCVTLLFQDGAFDFLPITGQGAEQ